MSTILARELDRADLLDQVSGLRAHGGRLLDVVRATRGDKAAGARVTTWNTITRALANQTSADNVALLPTPVLGSSAVAASAPVLASSLTQQLPPGKAPGIAMWPSATPARNVAEKTEGTYTVDGSDLGTLTMRTSMLAVNVSLQLLDFGVGADFDAWVESLVAADLETQLLEDLAAAGTTAADLPAALSACSPPATHVIMSMAATIAGASTIAALNQAGVANTPMVIVSPNTTDTLVVSAPAVVIGWHPVQVERETEPAILGVGVGAWASGVAGTSVASAVLVVS
jgi:hypothetical protein